MRIAKSRRQGISLIEMLVVIIIIGILVALTASAVLKFRVTGMRTSTSTNMGKVLTKLREQWKSVTDASQNESLDANVNYGTRARAIGGSDLEASRSAYVQLRQIQAFPTNINEAFWPIRRGSRPRRRPRPRMPGRATSSISATWASRLPTRRSGGRCRWTPRLRFVCS